MSRKSDADEPRNPDRRRLLGGMAAVAGAAAGGRGEKVAAASPRTSTGPGAGPVADARLREAIDTVVVIYAENRSFNNLFADFPGLERPLSAEAPERLQQRDRDGRILPRLPKIWEGLVPDSQVVEHRV